LSKIVWANISVARLPKHNKFSFLHSFKAFFPFCCGDKGGEPLQPAFSI
jgi:hypothetical protein